MNSFGRTQFPDHVLMQSCREHVSHERRATAELLADLAEVDARRLYAPAGYSSLYAWCVGELRLSENAAYKRIQAAKASREFPALLDAVADGRLHLSAVVLLAPNLSRENVSELIAATTHKTCEAIKLVLAERFPRPDVPTSVRPVTEHCGNSLDLKPVILTETEHQAAVAATPETCVAPPTAPPARVAPLAPGRYELRGTLDADAHADLRVAQELLGVHAGDAIAVIARALKLLRRDLERRRCAATDRPRTQRRTVKTRTIPAAVRREVWQRDGGQCTFTSETGHRCEERKALECDHIIPEALGGDDSAANLRLRCRAHNHLEAERVYGRAFMEGKREAARERKLRRQREREQAEHARREARAAAAETRAADARREAELRERACEVVPWLRQLGFRADEAKRAAESAAANAPGAPLEQRVKFAIATLAPRGARNTAMA